MDTPPQEIYNDGSYFENNPTWHEEDAPFKSKYIFELLRKNNVSFSSIGEVGCGAGGVLRNLQKLVGRDDLLLRGFDISSQAISLAKQHDESRNIEFLEGDLLKLDEYFDVLLVVDVIEHIPNYMEFMSVCRKKARHIIYHIPLDIHVSAAARDSFLRARNSVGHLHYFSQSTAIATLEDTGHTIVDTLLTPGALELAKLHPSIKRSIANVPRRILGTFSQASSARFFGGYSLLALTK